MMTLKEAIKHCKDVALSCTNKECALEHFQLLKWLQEYSNMLEKQGEHNKFRDSIQIGDKVTRNEDGVLVNLSQLNRVAKKQGKQETLCGKCRKEQPSHSCQDITALGRCAVEHEQKPAEFDDANAKRMFIKALERVEEQNNKGYKLTDCDKNSWWEDFKTYTSCTVEQKFVGWSEEDEKNSLDIKCLIGSYRAGEAEYRLDSWIDSLKDRVQPKQEWCEEDEARLKSVISLMKSNRAVDPFYDKMYLENWLKSLKDRVQPKQELNESGKILYNRTIEMW